MEAALLHVANNVLRFKHARKRTIIAYLRNDALVLGKSMRLMLATTPSTICFFRKQCGVTWIFCELSLSKRSEFR